jgi:threonine dehydrogenase-like Zn-dependent dehydrogenase
MKFSLLLLILYQKLKRASKKNAAFKSYISTMKANILIKTADGPKQAFQIALEMMEEGRIQVADMLTHQFPLEDYRKMIEVNINKNTSKAMKTAIRFETT